jgi:hypothetical protein
MPQEAIRFRCPHCTRSVRVPGSFAGKKGRCPRCKGALRVPSHPSVRAHVQKVEARRAEKKGAPATKQRKGEKSPKPTRGKRTKEGPSDLSKGLGEELCRVDVITRLPSFKKKKVAVHERGLRLHPSKQDVAFADLISLEMQEVSRKWGLASVKMFSLHLEGGEVVKVNLTSDVACDDIHSHSAPFLVANRDRREATLQEEGLTFGEIELSPTALVGGGKEIPYTSVAAAYSNGPSVVIFQKGRPLWPAATLPRKRLERPEEFLSLLERQCEGLGSHWPYLIGESVARFSTYFAIVLLLLGLSTGNIGGIWDELFRKKGMFKLMAFGTIMLMVGVEGLRSMLSPSLWLAGAADEGASASKPEPLQGNVSTC